VLLTFLALGHQLYHSLHFLLCKNLCLNRPAGRSGPWSHHPASVFRSFCCYTVHELILRFHVKYASHSHPLWAIRFVSLRLELRLTLDPLIVGAVDVHFPTSLTSDVSDAMYVLGPSIFVGFAVGDIGTPNATIQARTSRPIQIAIWTVMLYAPIAS